MPTNPAAKLVFAITTAVGLGTTIGVSWPDRWPARMAVSAAAASDTALVGTWELVSARTTRGDSVIADVRAPAVRSMKFLTLTHFSFITVEKDSVFVRAAAGRYTAEHGRYSESVEISSGPRMRGRTYEFTYRIEGDLWYHRGGMGAVRFDEVWRRVR